MISPTKTAEHVISDGLAGERRQFTIKATGKAFRTLIDGLYTNKIGALVRELISNGYDSHAAAGISDVPVMVTAPTRMDPIFKVRDFGTSMDHNTIMDLYSTIFESSKEQSNDQVGMFGLGSKSPFAYTDTFSVTAFSGTEKRVYVAHISDDDIPQITHIATEPADEPRGIEVTVPAKVDDTSLFAREIQKNILASDVTPIVDGLTVTIPEPYAKGDGWRIYDDTFGIGRVGVRQGCVIYPLHNFNVPSVNYGYSVVVDVPIGTVDVVASREALSLTPATTGVVREALQEVDRKVRQFAESIQFENRLDAFRKHNQYGFLAIPVGQGRLVLTPDKPNKELAGQYFQYFKSAKKFGTLNSTDDPTMWTFLVERDGEKVLRKQLRIAAYFKRNHTHRNKLALINARDLPRIVRLFGLTPKQIVSVASLPDVPVAPRVGTAGSYGSTGTAAPRVKRLPKGTFWVPKIGVSKIDLRIGGIYVHHGYSLKNVIDWTLLGFTRDLSEVVFLTDKQAQALKAGPDTLFTAEVEKRAAKYAVKHNFQAKQDAALTEADFEQYLRNMPIKSHLGMTTYDYSQLSSHVASYTAEILRAEFQPQATVTYTLAEQQVAKLVSISGTSSLQKAAMDARVKDIVSPFKPLAKGDWVSNLIKFYSENQ